MKTCPICQNPMIADSAEYCPRCGQVFHGAQWLAGVLLRLVITAALVWVSLVLVHLLTKY